ncbi:MAG: rRNA maturation RNase YbeY [Clostridia bacterium]|nr:rRNA maturation RNase YbeY [Clostridia bacterium]
MKLNLKLQNKTNAKFADEKLLTKVGKQVLKIFNQQNASISLTVFYVDEKEIKQINKDYRNIDKITDVISFRLIDNPKNLPLTKENFLLDFDEASKTIYLGEIFVCEQVAITQSSEFDNTPFREALELFIHGFLHILGCDHHKKDETLVMKNYEEQMISYLNENNIF